MTAAAPESSSRATFLPDLASIWQYIGAWSVLSVLQYFVAETAVIGAWAGPGPYDRRTGFISDLGAVHCGVHEGRTVCSPLHLLMNLSFIEQGLGMLAGALLLGSALLRIAARPGVRLAVGGSRETPWQTALWARVLTGISGAGTVVVGLVPEDSGLFLLHLAGAVMFFSAGAIALLLFGVLWLRQTPLAGFILACGAVSLGALITGGVTRMDVPEPGTLERLMGYPITIGLAAVGLVVAQRMHHQRQVRKSRVASAARPA